MMEGTWASSRNVGQLCTQARLTLYNIMMFNTVCQAHHGGKMGKVQFCTCK